MDAYELGVKLALAECGLMKLSQAGLVGRAVTGNLGANASRGGGAAAAPPPQSAAGGTGATTARKALPSAGQRMQPPRAMAAGSRSLPGAGAGGMAMGHQQVWPPPPGKATQSAGRMWDVAKSNRFTRQLSQK